MLNKYPDQVNLVLKHFPLSMHKAALPASLAALAAANQDKYRAMSAVLFKNYRSLNNESIKRYAQQVGLDMAAYEKDITTPSLRIIIAQDMQAARQFKVRGVPTIFIGGRAVKNRSFDGLEQMIKKELEKAK